MSTTDPTPNQPAGKRSLTRRLLKWSAILLGVLLALIIVLVLAARYAAQSGFGREFVETRIEAADPSGQEIEVEGLSGDLLGTFRIDRLTVADEDGIWLIAENLLADWKPFDLRKRALTIEALEADLIHVLRRPVLQTSENEPSSGGSMPLRAGELGRLRIGELRTDAGVIPRTLSLNIQAQGRVGRDGGRSEMAVVPLDGNGDELLADLTWSDDFRVQGELALDGPAGGLFASLARLDPDQSISAKLGTEGALNDWRADADIEIGGASLVTLDAEARDQIISFQSDIQPALHPLTRQIAKTLGETLTIEGDLSRGETGLTLDITAMADGLELSAIAQRAEGGGYRADLRLTADNPTRYANVENLSVGEAMVDGVLVYAGGTARFDGDVRALSVDVPSFEAETVSGPMTATYRERLASVRTTLTAAGAALPGTLGQIAGRAPVLVLNGDYDIAQRTIDLRETVIRGRAGRIAAQGDITLAPSLSANVSGSFQIDGNAAELARPVNLQGNFEASRAGAGSTRFNTRINATELGALPAPLSDWATGSALVNVRGVLQPDNAVDLSQISLESGTLSLDGSGRLSSEQAISASLQLQAGEAAVAGYALDSVSGRADVSGTLDAMDFVVNLNAPQLASESFTFTDIALAADGTYGGSTINASVSLGAGTTNGPLDIETGVAINGADWQVDGLEASWGPLTANATISGSGGELGAMRGEANVRGELPDGLPARRIDASAFIEGEALTIDATLEEVAAGPTRADALVIRATGTPDDADFIVEMDGSTEVDGLSYRTLLNVDGNLSGLTSGATELVAGVDASLGELTLVTQEPLRYASFEDGMKASTELAALGGSVSASLTTRGNTQLRASADGLNLAPLLVLIGRPALDGALDLSLAFDETAEGGLSGPIEAEMRGVARPGTDLPPVDLFVSGTLQSDLLDLALRALDNKSLEARATIQVPVNTFENAPFIQPVSGASMPFSANASGQIEAIAALFIPPQMVLQGVVDADLSGDLPSLNESFSGTVQFSDGVFEHGDLGMVLNRISADARLGSGTVTLASFAARGRSGGTLEGSGSMAVDGSGRSDVEIRANRLVVTERREGSATVSGTLSLNQQPDLFEITGDLTVDEGSINLANLPQGGPPTLDVTFRQPGEEEEEEDVEEAATRLDISLNAPGRIDISGRGVNAELALDADIEGPIGSPIITGQAEIVRGRFDLIGKRFEFGESTVRLAPDLGESRLSVRAEHETRDDITAILNVVGTVSRPEIELTSEPVLPEDEVLSRVLFGRSPTQLTALETARLAAALAQLSGGGGFDLLGGIETALGLDTFDVGSGASGGVEVTSGKYLTDNVYLEVRSGATGAPGIAIEWEPIENIEVEAATNTGEEQGQELSVQWTRDFDDPGSGKKD
ncbi:translocation/assembly module TamB domain-containing protein [Henriciella marina]|uniref:Translocation/assembly module TamB domain-containing protein n=1 Tax=Henriciella marina TaxID=453851 RepID=A0ABT4LYE7_9PROT|nr:translocation/assembly module TamB domain-containing protein [Henriciella marina]MCZ4299356.1 translocation/assembly module TamB domain-containing protein [Henriciella marina]